MTSGFVLVQPSAEQAFVSLAAISCAIVAALFPSQLLLFSLAALMAAAVVVAVRVDLRPCSSSLSISVTGWLLLVSLVISLTHTHTILAMCPSVVFFFFLLLYSQMPFDFFLLALVTSGTDRLPS